jgi:hypothetical protein
VIRTSYDAPDTLDRDDQWRSNALCATPQHKGHANLWFPNPTDSEGIAAAKRVCAGCPVAAACLAYALDQNIGDGIFGSLTHSERASYRRRRARSQRTHPLAVRTPQPAPKTLAEAFTRRTQRTDDGHLLWYGAQQMKFQGTKYTSLQAAFIVGRGREPEGPVRRTCGTECYRGDHLTDALIRDSDEVCGSRRGYQRHRARGEDACDRCRQANTDADNRLRRTGTSKVSA